MQYHMIGSVSMIVASVLLVGCSDKPSSEVTEIQTNHTKTQTQPVSLNESPNQNNTKASEEAATTVAVAPLSIEEGKKRYEISCKACHEQGLLDAPKIGDKVAWQPRIAKGKDVLYTHSAKGFNKMPSQVTGDVSEAEVYAAVDYIIQKSS